MIGDSETFLLVQPLFCPLAILRARRSAKAIAYLSMSPRVMDHENITGTLVKLTLHLVPVD